MSNRKQVLINLKEALEKVCENCCCDFEECRRDGFCVDYTNIEQLPTVDAVEVVHGRWAMDEYKHQYCCSVCGTVQPYDSIEDYIDPDILYYDYWDCNYCPNCGAKMDLE